MNKSNFVSNGAILIGLAVLLTAATACSVAGAGTTQAATAGTTPVIMAGFVNADGSINTGAGFTSSVNQGTYTLTFPAGTFYGSAPPVVVLTPFYSSGNAMNFGSYSSTYPGDGSATISFNFNPTGGSGGNQVPFTFIATNGH